MFQDVGVVERDVMILDVGVEVAVNGEVAGAGRGLLLGQGRQQGGPGQLSIVEDAAGVQLVAPRSSLRHPFVIKQYHAGVTGYKKHDR